jgi:CBS domain-containing protein
MRVHEIMTRSVLTCRATDTLARAAELMWENDLGCLPVTRDGRVVGIVTDRDIAMVAYLKREKLADIAVTAAMSLQVLTCSLNDDVLEVERIMSGCQVRRLPVVDPLDRPIGVVSLYDIARASARGTEVTPAEVASTLTAVCMPRTTLPRV